MEQKVALNDGAFTTLQSWGTSGPAVVCVHGITSSRRSWERTALALEESFRVFAYDQRGHGDSADVPGPMTLAQSLDDLRAVVNAVGEPVSLIGHSWGGAVAVLGGRERFATRVVAVDPMIYVPAGIWHKEYLEDVERDFSLSPAALEADLRRRLSSWHERDVEGKLHAVKRMRAQTIARLGSENRVDEGGWDLRPSMVDYPTRVLVLAASPAESVMSEEDLAFLRARAGPNVTIVSFDDQGHNLHRTAFERYLAQTKAFLEV